MPKGEAAPALFREGELAESPDSIATAAFEAWNQRAGKFNWAAAKENTCGRPVALRRAVKHVGGLHKWRALLDLCGTSDFLCGRTTPRPFRFTLDWALKPANLLKLIEGNFIPEGERKAAESAKPAAAINWRDVLERYRKGGFWHPSQGNRPEDNGPHLAPAEFIEAWRKRHGVTGMGHNGPQIETREERMASSIISYRRIGQYDRANKIEEDLARLEKRPPVLVPAPDALNPDMTERPRPATARTPSAGKYGPSGGHTVTDIPLEESPPWDDIPEGAAHEADD